MFFEKMIQKKYKIIYIMILENKTRKGIFGPELSVDADTEQKAWKYIDYLVQWIKQTVESANCNGVVIGISGGIDSALSLALAKKAFGENIIAVALPINNLLKKNDHIEQLANSMNISIKRIDFTEIAQIFQNKLAVKSKLTIANIMPRIRMTALYALAQENNYLVCGTDNMVETYTGYFTKYGDGGVDFLPLSQLLKSEVKYLSKLLGVPQDIIDKNPSADLWENQTDEEELKVSYHTLDLYLSNEKHDIKQKNIDRIEYLHKISAHKRNMPVKPNTIEEIIKIKGD